MSIAVLDQDAITACVDLAHRSGARAVEIGYLNDEDDPAFAMRGPEWYAHAQLKGARITVEGCSGPTEATDGLARRLLEGAKCAHCSRPVSLVGTTGCRWTRMGARWARGCEEERR